MKYKPFGFGIRFYAVVRWSHCYLHSLFENGSGNPRGNRSGTTAVQRHNRIFRHLRGTTIRNLDESLVAPSSASALWCSKLDHQPHNHPCSEHGRLVVRDKFDTRHVTARQVHKLTDGETKIISTVKFNDIHGLKQAAVNSAIEIVKEPGVGAGCYANRWTLGKRKTMPLL